MLKIFAGCCFHRGYKKTNNEDNFLFAQKILADPMRKTGTYKKTFLKSNVCFAVFDGMGGLPAGEQASRVAARALSKLLQESRAREKIDRNWLYNAFSVINREVACYSRKLGYQIGTTAAVILFSTSSIIVGNVGDSRIYRYASGRLEQISQDHSDRELLEELGIKERKPSLLQFIGQIGEKRGLYPSVSSFCRTNYERYLVCSDGLTDMVQDKKIEEVCGKYKAPLECAQSLVQCALEKGGEDNITVIVCDLIDGEKSIIERVKALIARLLE